ncbi:endonuclease/exonuclease/phosphatase family protein [Roseomonas sp. WA12]
MNLDRLSFGTFNLFNLNEPGRAIYTDREGWSEEEYERKIAWTASHIASLRPDILGFQELWHRAALQRALDRSGLSDDYDLLAPADADGARIVNAAILRKGLLDGEPEWVADFPDKFRLESSGDDPQTPAIEVRIGSFSRPVLHFRARVRDDHDPVHVYVCHFKSKAPTQVWSEAWYRGDEDAYRPHRNNMGAALSTIRRTAEASALRFMLTQGMKGTGTPVVVLGDINDGQHSNTVNILTEQPRYLVGDARGGGDTALYTAQTLQEYRNTRDVYYTHIHQDIMESLDHILVSQEFYDNSRRRLWIFDGMSVRNDHLDSADHKADGTNDHGIVCARFRFRPARSV